MQRDLRSGNDLINDFAGHIGETEIATVETIGELLVMEAHEMKDRCVQIVDADAVLNGAEAELIGCAVMNAAFHTTTCHPESESMGIVIATGFRTLLGDWKTTKFTPANHERRLE